MSTTAPTGPPSLPSAAPKEITYENLANELGIDMIAEGVETKEQADFLKENGCMYAQGYYYYKPMPIEEFAKLLENSAR